MSFFGREFFEVNRHELLERTKASVIVLAANGLVQRSADTTFKFRQDSNFWYFTGVEESDFLLVISEAETFLIAPKRGEHRDQWDGKLDKKSIKETSGIDDIKDYYDGWNRLDILLKKYKKVHTITPAEDYLEHFGFYTNPARGALLKALSKHRKLQQVDIRNHIARMRQIKQPVEVEAMRKAIKHTTSAFKKVYRNLHKYNHEYEIVAEMTRDFIRRNVDGHAYEPIVASGINAATIHYTKNNSTVEAGDLVLLDVGAEFSNYSADISRTYSVNKQPNKRQKEIFESVKRVHDQAISLLVIGADMKKYEQEVDKIMAKELVGLKLIDDVDNKRQLKKFYPHLTSHFLGLDTHDSADYKLPLSPGMVLTVEPGIYIPDEKIGIRIEDDILITKSGVEVLSSALPIGL